MLIYSIINTVNGKRYIGQTTQTKEKRWTRHRTELNTRSHGNLHLTRAWHKYGKAAFKFEVIEDNISTLAELNEKEKRYIASYNTMNEAMGYNKQSGGDNGYSTHWETRNKQRKSHQQIPTKKVYIGRFQAPDGTIVTEFGEVSKFCRDNNINDLAFRCMLRGDVGTSSGWINLDWVPSPKKTYRVNLVDPNGNYYSEIIDLKQFANTHGLRWNGLKTLCNGFCRTYKGWTNLDVDSKLRVYDGFVAPDGTEHKNIVNLSEFCRTHNLILNSMWNIDNRRNYSHKGWTRIDLISRIKHHGVEVIDPNGNKWIIDKVRSFCTTHNISDRRNFTKLLAGKISSHNGWTVFSS